jgi:hypothetical protein
MIISIPGNHTISLYRKIRLTFFIRLIGCNCRFTGVSILLLHLVLKLSYHHPRPPNDKRSEENTELMSLKDEQGELSSNDERKYLYDADQAVRERVI